MVAVEPLLGSVLIAATVTVVALAGLMAAAFIGRGPLYRRLLDIDRSRRRPRKERIPAADPNKPAHPVEGLLIGRNRPWLRRDVAARLALRPNEQGLDEVLSGSFASVMYNRAVRVMAWSSILMALLIVVVSQLWQPVQPAILATLVAAGFFVLLVQEVTPRDRFQSVRVLIEGTATVIFLTVIVLLTGYSTSPFFYLYPIFVGGVALIAAPRITMILILESVVAYATAAFAGPMDSAATRDTLARIGINVTALVLLAYAGTVMSQVQSRTRETAIRLSTIDSLTDLFNRAYFFSALDREIRRGERFGRGFCLLMMDLDGLKTINDRYGHFQGDVILRGVARLIRAGLRGIDVAARYGGDEFVALLPETDPSGAFVVAEKIRQTVTEVSVEVDGDRIHASLSIGVVSYPDDGVTADELMIAADAAMYTSKRLGKNRVVGYAKSGETQLATATTTPPTQFTTPGFTPIPRSGNPPAEGGRWR
jgi:diguanylate cyclase (GGDEF)-like protein